MRLAIVMVTPRFHPEFGGAESQALELSKALASRGAAVQVLTRRTMGAGREEMFGISVRRFPVLGPGLLDPVAFMLWTFAWLLRHRGRFDVIHVHLGGSPAVAAAVAGRLLGRPVFVKLGGGRGIGELALSSRTVAGRLKLRLLAWLKPRFVAVTRDLLEELREHGLGAAPAVVVPNGVDISRFCPSPDGKTRLRAELGLPAGPAFLYVGRLAPEKRLSGFLAAFARALHAPPSGASCVLAGSGPEEGALRAEALQLGLAGHVWFRGPVAEVTRLYAAADVFILPSISEGLSNALLEAMASGLAVLASKVGGTAEAVTDGQEGLLFAPEDRAGLESALGRLLAEPQLARALGLRARERALARYDIREVAKRYMELYTTDMAPLTRSFPRGGNSR